MMDDKYFVLTDLNKYIQILKNLNFSSKETVETLYKNYPDNYIEIGELSEKKVKDFLVGELSEREVKDFLVDELSEREVTEFLVDELFKREATEFLIGKLSKREVTEFFIGKLSERKIKEHNYYKKKNTKDHHSSTYKKTLIIKQYIYYSDLFLKEGKKLTNLPCWNKLTSTDIYHKTHIIAKEFGGKRFFVKEKFYNGFIGTEHANVGPYGNSGMRTLENIMKNHLMKNKNNHILVEGRVIYKNPEDIVPIFVIIIMVSNDYKLNKIYCVLNIQKNHIINYKTGSYSSIQTENK